ncbi:MAG: hypothetical protein OHK0056_26650 [Bacteriovoracaceae bacterium]
MENLISPKQKGLIEAFQKFRARPITQEYSESAYLDYLNILEREGAEAIETLPDNVESTLAMLDFYAMKLGRSSLDFNVKKQKRASLIVAEMKKRKKFDLKSVESVLEDLIELKYPANYRFGSDEVTPFLRAQIHRELVREGLEKMFVRYAPDRVPRLTKFSQSKWGEVLRVSFFNLPVLVGMPPIYLPKGKTLKLSKGLSDELLKNGLTPELEKQILKSYYGEIGVRFSADYSWLRKRYMVAVGVYLTAAYVYDFYFEQQSLNRETAELEELNREANELLGFATDLEKAGFDVFDDKQDLSQFEGNRFCQLIENCLRTHLGRDDLLGASMDLIEQCRKFMDPSGKCRSY